MKKQFVLNGILSIVILGSLGSTAFLFNEANSINEEISILNEVEREESIEIVDFSSGIENSAAITNENGTYHLYTWGAGTYNALGNGKDDSRASYTPIDITPTPWLNSDSGIVMKDVEIGKHNGSLIVNDNGTDQLYTWGTNNNGEAGIGNNTADGNDVVEFDLIESAEGNEEFVKIENSESVSSLVVRNSDVDTLYTWGSSENPALGQGSVGEDILSPTEVKLYEADGTTPFSDTYKILDYENNGSAGMLVEDSSSVKHIFQWGDKATSTPTEFDIASASVITGDIVQYHVGPTNAGILTVDESETQRLYMSGAGEAMGLGTTGEQGVTLVAKTGDAILSDAIIKDFKFGSNLSMVVVEDDGQDKLFTAGFDPNEIGMLGTGITTTDDKGNIIPQPWTQVGTHEFDGQEIKMIDTPGITAGVIANDGVTDNLYMWGQNANGEFGNGDNENLSIPFPILEQKSQNVFDETSMQNVDVTMDTSDSTNETFDLSFKLIGKTGQGISVPNSYRSINIVEDEEVASKSTNEVAILSFDGQQKINLNYGFSNEKVEPDIKYEDGLYYKDYSVDVKIENIPFGRYDSLYINLVGNRDFLKVNTNNLNISNEYELSTTEFTLEEYDQETEKLTISFKVMDAFNNFDKDNLVIKVNKAKGNGSTEFEPEFVVETQNVKSLNYEKTYIVELSGIDNNYTYSNWRISLTGETEDDDFIKFNIINPATGDVWYPMPDANGISVETMIWLLILLVILIVLIQAGSSTLLLLKLHSSNKKDLEEAEKLQYMALTRKQVMDLLVDQNVEFDKTAPKAALVELAWHHSKEEEDAFDEDDYEHWKDFDFATLEKEELKEWLTEHNVEFDGRSSKEKLADIANHFYHVEGK